MTGRIDHLSVSQSELVDLIALAKRQGGEARGRLLELYRNYLRMLARVQVSKRLQGRVSPSDLAQETIIVAERELHAFRGKNEAEFVTWLRRVLSTQIAKCYRHHGALKRDMHLERKIGRELDKSSQLFGQALEAKQTTPSRAAARREEAVLLADAMQRLPSDYREVVLLRNFEAIPFEEVAERMGRTVHSVKNIWARALARLRETIEYEQ